jgi:hypothetical protein
MRIITTLAACCLLTACWHDNRNNTGSVSVPGNDIGVQEFSTDTGVRCIVVWSRDSWNKRPDVGGVTCDWNSAPRTGLAVPMPDAARAMVLPDGTAAWVSP